MLPIATESIEVKKETVTEIEESVSENNESEAPQVNAISPMGIGPQAVNTLDVVTDGLDMRIGNHSQFMLVSVADSNKNPWTKVFTIYNDAALTAVGIYIYWINGGVYRKVYYRTYDDYKNDSSFISSKLIQIEVEIPAEVRNSANVFRYNPTQHDATYGGKIWGYRTGYDIYNRPQEGTFSVKSASGSVVPTRPITLTTDGTKTSGKATFSLTNASIHATNKPKIYFFTNRAQAAASPPNLGNAQAVADCTVSGNTLTFSNKDLTRGTTYYYRYYIETNYSDIKIFSDFNDNYRITMPDVTLPGSQGVSISSDGLRLDMSSIYSLVSPFEGTATIIFQANSRFRFYTSYSNAVSDNWSNGRSTPVTSIDTANKRMMLTNYTDLVSGVTYWYRTLAATNYSSISRWTDASDSRKVTMPKLTISAPTITPIGTDGTINAAVTSTLLGTNANYPANTSKVYIFDSEQKANNKEIASRVLEGNLTHNGTQMKVDNLNGLTPGKKYWARFYVGSNYSAINQWSAVVPFSTPYAVNEEYYDLSGNHLKNETVTISDGSTYQPSEADINHNSKDYIYYGWLDASEMPGVDTPKSTPFTANDNSTVKLIYLDKDLAFFLRNVPKFDFGTVEASDTNQDYALDTASYGGSSDDLSVEYLDKRAASTGWSLKAQMSELAMVQSPSDKLTNATLTMARKLQVLGSSNSWSDTLPSGINDYGGSAITLNAGGGEVNVFSSGTASAAECSGIWRDLIDFDSVKLHVQGSTALSGAKYSGKVTWTLDDTP